MTILINTFCTLLICCSALVVLSASPIYSVLFLILAFANASALTLLAGHDYIAVLFIVLYVGAMCTFFLFALMILDIKKTEEKTMPAVPTLLFIGLMLAGLVANSSQNTSGTTAMLQYAIQTVPNQIEQSLRQSATISESYIELNDLMDSTTQIYNLGSILYTTFGLHLIGASLILLSVMLGSIALTLNRRSSNAKTQYIFEQNLRDYKKSIVKYS